MCVNINFTLALYDRSIGYIKGMNIKRKYSIKRLDSQIMYEALDTVTHRKIRTATVLITYFDILIALEYHTGWYAPLITLKEKGMFAFTITNMAKRIKTPIVEDRGFACELYTNTKSGDYLPEAYYEAVAIILAPLMKKQKYPFVNKLCNTKYIENNHSDIKTLPLIEVAKYLDIKVERIKTEEFAGEFYYPQNNILLNSSDIGVFIHELAHGVDYVLGNSYEEYYLEDTRNFDEVVAELSTIVLCKTYNIPFDYFNSISYLNDFNALFLEKNDLLERVSLICEYIKTIAK